MKWKSFYAATFCKIKKFFLFPFNQKYGMFQKDTLYQPESQNEKDTSTATFNCHVKWTRTTP